MPKIWSPVILAELDPPRSIEFKRYYQLQQSYHAIADLRVKVQSCEAISHGKHVESLISVVILALMLSENGEPELLSFNDLFKEWLSVDMFDPPIPFKLDTAMIVEVDRISCEGELKECTLEVRLNLAYTVLAVQNEAIELSPPLDLDPTFPDPEPYYPGMAILETISKLENEVQRLAQDNSALNQRIILYEKNLGLLKNAVRKAEGRSQELFHELLQSRRSAQALQEKLAKKEAIIVPKAATPTKQTVPTLGSSRFHIGDKIKQLFALG